MLLHLDKTTPFSAAIPLALIVCMFCTASLAQTYHATLRDDVVWETRTYDSGFSYASHSYTWIDAGSDTTIGGLSYRSFRGNSEVYWRENLNTGQVFRYTVADSNEVVFFDYSLGVGDLLFVPVGQNDSIGWTVQSIGTQTIAGTARKTLHLSSDTSTCPVTMIEGVGIDYSFNMMTSANGCLGPPELHCYRYKDQLTPLWGFSCTPVGVPGGAQLQVEIYPNPATNNLRVSTFDAVGNLFLYSTTGKQVLHYKSTSWQNEQILNVAALPPGMYLLFAETPKGTVHKKISIVR